MLVGPVLRRRSLTDAFAVRQGFFAIAYHRRGMTMRCAMWVVAGLALAAGCNKDKDTTSPNDVDATAADDDLDDDLGDDDVDGDDDDDGAGGGGGVEEEAFLTLSLFEETVNANLQDVVDCYGTAKAANDALGDQLIANFHIDGEGKVTEVSAEKGSSIDDAAMMDCVRDRASGWGFAPPPDHEATTMVFPFQFGG